MSSACDAMPTPDGFRAVMSRFATGVTVMTCASEDGFHGMTANAVAAVSLDPLLVLVCVGHNTDMRNAVRDSGHFALSILAAGGQDLAEHFAGTSSSVRGEKFAHMATQTEVTGAPLLQDALGWLDCHIWRVYDGGDHEIVVGQVVACDVGEDVPALGYFQSGYTTLHRAP